MQKQFRIDIWDALKSDDAIALVETLEHYGNTKNQTVPHVLARTSRLMWNRRNHTHKGLLEACCCNINGVGDAGCPDCAKAVVDIINQDIGVGNQDYIDKWDEWRVWTGVRLENLSDDKREHRQWVTGLLDSIMI